MLSSRSLNNPKRKPNADGLVTYYYTSVAEPTSGTYYCNGDYYIIPAKVTPEVYAELIVIAKNIITTTSTIGVIWTWKKILVNLARSTRTTEK